MLSRTNQSLAQLVCTFVLMAAFAAPLRAADKPNILFIFADDHAYNTVHATGNAQIKTPNLDRIAKSGTVFTHAYNMGGWHGAVCVASRTMLNTGRFMWRARDAEKTLKSDWQANGKLWSQLLAKAGYDTFFTGKWHVRADTGAIFKYANHVRGGMPRQTRQGYDRPHEGKPDPWDPADPKFGGFWQGGKHWSEVVADDAITYLDTAKKSDNPFFMYIAFNAPHDPRQAPRKYVDMYPWKTIDLPLPFNKQIPHSIVPNGLRDERLAPFPRTQYAVKVNRAEYYAIITHMDAQIGRILDHLEKTGQKDNTYIVFTADHGLACGHHGFMGKQNMYDHSVRVPFFIAGPTIPKGKSNPAAIYLQDVVPTSLDLAGVKTPDYVEFKSLLPLISGKRDRSYDAVYGAYTMTQRMVTQDGWKLLVYPQKDVTLLYNLKNDPLEQHNLADKAEHAGRIAKLRAKLLALQKEMGDPLVVESTSQ